MSRQLEQFSEERDKKRRRAIVAAVEYDLQKAVERAGGDLLGFSTRMNPGECLVTLRVIVAGRRQVAFVGAEDLGTALIKAVRLGNSDKLGFRDDKYST